MLPVALLLPSLFALLVSTQGAPPKPDAKKDGRKEVAQLIADMKKDTAAKKDDDAIGKIDKLVNEFSASGPADKKLISDNVAKNLELQRLPAEGSKEQPKIFQTTIVALGAMGEFGSKHLMEAFELRDFKRDTEFRGKMIKNLGSTKDLAAVDFLLKRLVDKEAVIVADTATALGNFNAAKEETRKKIVEKLVNDLNSAQSQAADASTPQGAEAKRRYETISPSFIETLQKLSNQTFRQPIEWQKWWNNNKTKPWS